MSSLSQLYNQYFRYYGSNSEPIQKVKNNYFENLRPFRFEVLKHVEEKLI